MFDLLSHSVLNIGFQGVVGSSRAWCPHISIVMSVLCVVSVFCRGGSAASVFCWREGSYRCDSEIGAKASPVCHGAVKACIQDVKISSRSVLICDCSSDTSALREADSIVCLCFADQFILSVGFLVFLHRLDFYFYVILKYLLVTHFV